MNPQLRELEFPHAAVPAPAATVEVVPGVHWLRMPLPFALDHINLWLLEDGEGYTIVDCGFASDETRRLWEEIFAVHVNGRTVRRVVATHFHPDHMGLAHWLTERFGVDLWTPQAEFLMAHAVRGHIGPFAAEPLIELFRANGIDAEKLELVKKRGNSYGRGVPALPVSFRRIMDGDVLEINGRSWRAIMGYGHSPEHAALYCEEMSVLISGDMVLPSISTNVSVWAADPLGNPLKLFLESITRYGQLPADTLILPSHGLPFRGLHPRVAQLHRHHLERLAEVEVACDEPRHACDLIPVLFRRKLDMHQVFFALGESIAHLHYLESKARLVRLAGGDGVIRFVRPQ